MPCDSNRRPPTFRSDCVKHCTFVNRDHLQKCFLAASNVHLGSMVGRWAQVAAKSHSLRYAAGSPASARHARADAQHKRSQYERLFKDTAPSPPHAVGAHVRVCGVKKRALECLLETHSGSWDTWKNVRAAALTMTILARNPSSPLKWTTPRIARR